MDIIVAFCCFWIGFLVGRTVRDNLGEATYRAQQIRGDYWFNRYQEVIRNDWHKL